MFKGFLFCHGLLIEKLTEKELVRSLIKSLHPYQTDYELIRLGSTSDGGYLVPNDLKGLSACYSPGVGAYSSFEDDCSKIGMRVFLADKSVDGPMINNDRFIFIKKFIGPITQGDTITIDDWVNNNTDDEKSDLLMQMDIEGDEYLTIISISESLLKRFRIIVIEFHQLERLFNKEFYTTAASSFQKILKNHVCVHIHPNNYSKITKYEDIQIPGTAEFTFLRKDRISHLKPATIFPHQLDHDCTNNPTIVLPECWYR